MIIILFILFYVSNAFTKISNKVNLYSNKLNLSPFKSNANLDKEFNDLYLSNEIFIDDYNSFLKNEKIKLQKENKKTITTIEQTPNNNLMSLNNINIGDIITYSILFYILFNTFSSGFIKVPNWFKTKNDDTKINLKKENITIASFAGSPEILDEFSDIILFFKNFDKYKNAGATVPKGYLLEGAPGCGKTLLAKIIASECNVNFISVSGSDFVELYVGNGARKIRNLFDEARKNKPAIIFIDEIDAVGRQRGSSSTLGNQEQEQTLNQLLSEMDGFNNNDNIIIIGATNRKDILDKALLRPNRFDRIITIQPPDFESRKKILELYLINKKYDKNIIIEHIADLTNGMSGADLKNLINEATISYIKRNATMIENTDILNSLDKILIGIIKRNDTRTYETKNRIAIHELGHGLLVKCFNNYFKLSKITIKNTYSNVGGFTLFTNKDDVFQTKDSLTKRLIILLGGKACENIYFGDDGTSIGASMDLKEANELAYNMITKFGLGDTLINNKENSEITKSMIDNEVIKLLSECYDEAKNILLKNKIVIDDLIIKLLDKETIYDYDF